MKLRQAVPAAILLLPVALFPIFDPAAWGSRYNLVLGALDTFFFIDVPLGLCLCHWFRPHWFKGARIFGWGALVFFGGWAFVAGGMFLAIQTGHGPDNGFSAFCAFFFGWLYLFVTLIPITLIYLLFRGIFRFLDKMKWRKMPKNPEK